ncbi:hypothetical protein HYH02_001046 [Chlamydomonas schloesseri]|uniref:C3HC-type domain-containing protein n=1 Tax=Chlamydomonas schloesseri TaxID=2026947 RepID=A0A835WTN0_9CHLO|nr:hypothetical protein HYH02_001046 [Chlamydomonas schloesseri]|eukprot:KAG2454003.1 hypothetical protein HYH02_001046 [Chlamydomonas schloesseri]
MSSVYERITSALSSLGKRRERDSGAHDGSGASAAGGGPTSPSGGSATARTPKRFRPWEQADLHKRLETYKPLTWFGKPASVGPVPCALKGWVNDGSDSLTCEYCGSKLMYPPHVSYNQRQAAADMFSPSLTTKHTATCPWRQSSCKPTLLAYVPSSTPEQLCSLFYSLNDKLMRVDVLPDMDTLAIQTLRSTAMPYGSYDDFITAAGPGGGAVIGGGAAAAGHGYGGYSQDLAPRRRKMPSVTIRELDDNGDEVMTPTGAAAAGGGGAGSVAAAAAAAAGGGGDPAAVLQALAAAGDAAEGQAVLVQTSKLAPAQKARLLALLGWDVDVLQPDSASGMAVAPYAAGGAYSLNHLGVKPKAGAAAASSGAGAGGKAGKKVPSSQVVLKCPICNSRMGLWNYSGVRPVPVGRLTAPPPPSAGGAAALMLSPRPAGASGGGAAAAAATAPAVATAGSDPLSCTIAGGQYGQFGFGGMAAKPFGTAAAAAPFKFGSATSAAPVFGMAAMDVDASRTASASGGGASGLFGPSSSAAAAAAAPSAAAAAGLATPAPAGGLAGRKRKAEGADAMAVDAQPTPSATPAGMATPVAAPDGKRQRVATTPSWGGAGFGAVGGPASPGGGSAASAAAAASGQPRELDPVAQHRSWCPWVYTGSGDEKHMSGWQHMLSALTQQQQQQQAKAAAAATPGAAAGASPAPPPPAAADAKQLRDNALEAIRKLGGGEGGGGGQSSGCAANSCTQPRFPTLAAAGPLSRAFYSPSRGQLPAAAATRPWEGRQWLTSWRHHASNTGARLAGICAVAAWQTNNKAAGQQRRQATPTCDRTALAAVARDANQQHTRGHPAVNALPAAVASAVRGQPCDQTRPCVPPVPPPLHVLPPPLPADSIPPLLDWVTRGDMRAVAAQSILDQHCSPEVHGLLLDALKIARAEARGSTAAATAAGAPSVITTAHLAMAALAVGYGARGCAAAEVRCCSDVAGVLHHSAGLPHAACAALLSRRAAEERSRRRRDSPPDSSQDERGAAGGSTWSLARITTAPALHLLLAAYRWAVFTGFDTVQPCHLLWVMAVDPRTCYSPLRSDPLFDGCAVAVEVWVPPLVWLLERAEGLTRPARVYEQLQGVLQVALSTEAVGSGPKRGGKGSSASGLDKGTPANVRELCSLLRVCREAGHVPSPRRLQALGKLFKRLRDQERREAAERTPGTGDGVEHKDPEWTHAVEAARAFAALGHRPPPLQQLPKLSSDGGQAAACGSGAAASLAPAEAACQAVQVWRCWRPGMACRLGAFRKTVRGCCRSCADASSCMARPCKRWQQPSSRLERLIRSALQKWRQQTWRPSGAAFLPSWRRLPAPGWWVRACAASRTSAASEATAAATAVAAPAAADLAAQRRCLLAFLASPAGTWLVGEGLCRIEDFCSIRSYSSSNGSSSTSSSSGSRSSAGCDEGNSSNCGVTVAELAEELVAAVPLARRAAFLHELARCGTRHSSSIGTAAKEAWVTALHAALAADGVEANSIHATRATQRLVVAGAGAAGLAVHVEWLQQIAAYGKSSGGDGDGSCVNRESAEAVAQALVVAAQHGVVAADGVTHRVLAGGGGASAPTMATAMGGGVPLAAAASSSTSDGASSAARHGRVDLHQLLGQLGAMLADGTEAMLLQPTAALEALCSLCILVESGPDGKRGTRAIRDSAVRVLTVILPRLRERYGKRYCAVSRSKGPNWLKAVSRSIREAMSRAPEVLQVRPWSMKHRASIFGAALLSRPEQPGADGSPQRTVVIELRGMALQLLPQKWGIAPPNLTARGTLLPLAEQDPALAQRLAVLGWQPLSPTTTPPRMPGVYWIGLRTRQTGDADGAGGTVVPLYHGKASNLEVRMAAHRAALEKSKAVGVAPPLYWGLRLADVVGTVVVAWEPKPSEDAAKAEEAAELARRNYAFNSADNEVIRVWQGLEAAGYTSEELGEIWHCTWSMPR